MKVFSNEKDQEELYSLLLKISEQIMLESGHTWVNLCKEQKYSQGPLSPLSLNREYKSKFAYYMAAY